MECVDIIGIAPSPIRNQKWWTPDGSPLLQPPIRREYGQVTGVNNQGLYVHRQNHRR